MIEHIQPIRIAVLTEAGTCEQQTTLTLSVLQATADEARKKADIEVYLIGASLMGIEGLNCEGLHRGQRWNHALGQLRDTDADAVLFLEPDTIIDAQFIETYVDFLERGYGGLSLFDHYVMDVESDRSVFWDGHTGPQRNTPLVNGRCISRRWLDEVQWSMCAGHDEDLTDDMKAKWQELICQAAHAGETRTFGCIASSFGVATYRAAGVDFFEQSGDSANTRPIDRAVFLEAHYGDMAEMILTGDVPDLSFDEPTYRIEDEDSDSAEQALASHEPNQEYPEVTMEHAKELEGHTDVPDEHTEALQGDAEALQEDTEALQEDTEALQEDTEAHPPNTNLEDTSKPEFQEEAADLAAEILKLIPAPSGSSTGETVTESAPPPAMSTPASKESAPTTKLKRRPIAGATEPTGEKQPITLTRRPIQSDDDTSAKSVVESVTPPASRPNIVDGPDPQTPEEWVVRGEAAFGEGDLDNAERCFRQALMLNPIHSVALNDLAVIHHQRGQANEAERLYLKAVTFDNEQSDAFVGLVGLAAATGQMSLAVRYAARGIKRAPQHPELLQVVNELTQSAGGITAERKGA